MHICIYDVVCVLAAKWLFHSYKPYDNIQAEHELPRELLVTMHIPHCFVITTKYMLRL